MKPTPVTRREQFLYALGEIQTLTPVTREEMYLGNLCGQNNVLPYPVTRYEQYLYKMCGGSIDVPTPVTRLEMFLYRACDIEYETPEPVTREEIYWDEYIKEYVTVKTLTGTLPLTFTAKAENAIDWVIYGNDYSINKIQLTTETVENDGTTFVVDGSAGTITANGRPSTTSTFYRLSFELSPGTYTFTGDADAEIGEHYMYIDYPGGKAGDYDFPGIVKTFTLSETSQVSLSCIFEQGNPNTSHVFKPMLCIDGETPTAFEPYQRGVGKRTKNLLEINETTATIRGVTFTVDKSTGTITTKGTATDGSAIFKIYIDTSLYGDFRFAGCANTGTSSTFYIDAYDDTTGAKCKAWDGTTTSVNCYNTEQRRAIQIPENHICCLRIIFARNVNADGYVFMPMIIDDETTQDTLIPYGYQIPITVSQTGQTDKNYDIFIGDSPLTEGETVTKSSTSVEIELFKGENTVSTTLTNKPEMSITYKGG